VKRVYSLPYKFRVQREFDCKYLCKPTSKTISEYVLVSTFQEILNLLYQRFDAIGF
jgi:hypothetical protein